MTHSYTGKGRAVKTPYMKDLLVRVRETWLICIWTNLIVCVSWLIRGSGKGTAVPTPNINDFFVRAQEICLIFYLPFVFSIVRVSWLIYTHVCHDSFIHRQGQGSQNTAHEGFCRERWQEYLAAGGARVKPACHTWMSLVTHDQVMSHMSHVPCESCHLAAGGARAKPSCHTWMSHSTHEWVMSHMTKVMSHMSHVSCESCHLAARWQEDLATGGSDKAPSSYVASAANFERWHWALRFPYFSLDCLLFFRVSPSTLRPGVLSCLWLIFFLRFFVYNFFSCFHNSLFFWFVRYRLSKIALLCMWESDKAPTHKIYRRASSEQRPRTRSCHESERLVSALFRSNVPFGKSFSRSSSRASGDFSQQRPENSLSSLEASKCHMHPCVSGLSLLI